MPDVTMTVKGYFTLAEDWEREALLIEQSPHIEGDDWAQGIRDCKANARRARDAAYRLLGVPKTDGEQRHMGEIMADF
jgi:hypothetical protein